ncbi:hypothetical protein N7448_000547 [Penicillium atrosanguineum]|uniref:Uncharacterized protein n=1 Tax=Penicillium atrosanguineum TaxID=1132637 RepID=A0A9W9Q388_9EURO|nr:uncharacterized protein N7443_003945 [Penicillium atrosanguineum]KAJ5134434.1 hypothetical protein N7526_005799 [Penicillium atrosanguineum]KAJ5148969.1 hypothetical protein N7448_000547 [Penicillium atrosanguineum]KAJ5304285.1 hypothetical protein N7443_003945 [Penicillium atrosanguineum]KAJ5323760.1 hypothetical protein N7476_002360 [Penicillium atrosanguineum]
MGESVGGWEIVSARNQEERSLADIGSTTPSHLTRVLYIPNHDGSPSHLPIHEITGQYKDTVGNRVMGTASYAVSLGKIPKPHMIGDGVATPLENAIFYNVNIDKAGEGDAPLTSVLVVPSSTKSVPIRVETDINNMESADGKATTITMKRQEDGAVAERPTTMSASYPIAPLTWRKTVFVHPYFAFQPPEEEKAYFEWQLHPIPYGRLRYTLVRVRGMQSTDEPAKPGLPSDHEILAIYHHIGDGVSLPLPYSEGVLLLSGDLKPETETMVVASAFGMLGELRRLSKPGKTAGSSKESKEGRFGFVKGLLNKK